jgi:hypothetical protein
MESLVGRTEAAYAIRCSRMSCISLQEKRAIVNHVDAETARVTLVWSPNSFVPKILLDGNKASICTSTTLRRLVK